MIYKIPIKGYILVEADTPEEAEEKADDGDYIEEYTQFGKARKAPEDYQI